jgi:hypothetical protein
VITVRPWKASDVTDLSKRLGNAEVKELKAYGWLSSQEALTQSASRSELCYSVVEEPSGMVLAMFGCVRQETLLSRSACMWLLGSDDMYKIRFTFVKRSKQIINLFLERFSILWNVIDARCVGILKMLQSLGARLEPMTVNGNQFVKFILVRK